MEQKKILWVMMSVALLLIVLLTAGLIWLKPAGGDFPVAGGTSGEVAAAGTRFDAIEYIREGEMVGLVETEPEAGEFVAVTGDIVLGQSQEKTAENTATPDAGAAVQLTSAAPVQRPAPRTEPAPAPVPKPTPTPKPAPVTETGIEYWIQAGSFTKIAQAEATKEALSARGVESVVQTRQIEGTTYYRVRIGPYGDKAEAEKFLGWVRNIPEYSSSYISEVPFSRTL
jgi:DedD protein